MKDPIIHQPSKLWGAQLIGNDTTIGTFCDIGNDVIIGKNCKIQAGVKIPPQTRIGNNVFIGANVVFTNDKYMDGNMEGVVVEDGVKIGAGAILMAGIKVGKNSIIGSGSVVIRDVPNGATVVGNPAKQVIKRDSHGNLE